MNGSLDIASLELQQLLDIAQRQLGGPCVPFELDWGLRTALIKSAARPQHRGLGDLPPVRHWCAVRHGHTVEFGMAVYSVRTPQGLVPVIEMRYPQIRGNHQVTLQTWFCAADRYRALYRFLRRSANEDFVVRPPLLRDEDRQRLWDNTVGFLLRGRAALERFGVALKRGVMLLGEPGNGKTMAARWLRSAAIEHGFEWKSVTGEEYDRARGNGEAGELLDLDEPGLIFLDDFDRGLEPRDQTGGTRDHSALLAALDGMEAHHGVVYVFTSNLRPHELDPAIRRPGRIDTFIEFPRPSLALRERFLREYWPEELRTALPLHDVATTTEGLSFAELDEVKKLLVLQFVEAGTWDWPRAWRVFRERQAGGDQRRPIGFNAAPWECARATALV